MSEKELKEIIGGIKDARDLVDDFIYNTNESFKIINKNTDTFNEEFDRMYSYIEELKSEQDYNRFLIILLYITIGIGVIFYIAK